LLSSVSHIWTAMSLATFTCASSVLAPKWGVHETLGWAKSFLVLSPGGSFSYTSKAAPPTWPASRASSRSISWTIPPRAQLIMCTPFFICCKLSRLIRFLVSGVRGVWRVMKSAWGQTFSRSHFWMPSS
jgi:hypothetical protein